MKRNRTKVFSMRLDPRDIEFLQTYFAPQIVGYVSVSKIITKTIETFVDEKTGQTTDTDIDLASDLNIPSDPLTDLAKSALEKLKEI